MRITELYHSTSSMTSFIGRTPELDEIGALLDDPTCRLLTLIGPGGIGKTRLATEAAARKQEAFPDGVFFVSLVPLNQPEDILMTIAKATPFRFHDDERDPCQQFLDYLHEKRAKHMRFVLDNFEHLLDGADTISDILAASTHLKILATSREPLNLPEEWVRQIAGMTYPDRENGRPLEDYSAVQLFLDRACRIRGDFDLTEDSRSVLEICQLVEGMPLAIELAVRWLHALDSQLQQPTVQILTGAVFTHAATSDDYPAYRPSPAPPQPPVSGQAVKADQPAASPPQLSKATI